MNVKNAILNQIMQAILANKEEYIAALEKALLDFVSGITLDGHNQPVIDEIKAKVATITADIKDVYGLIAGAVEKFGHSEVTK